MWAFIAYMLRFHRSTHRMTGTLVGSAIGVEKSEVSKLEYGDHQLREDHARTLDKLWNTGGLFELLVFYARVGHNPDWLGEHFSQEARALVIKVWHGGLVPGLFQTEEYARAGLEAGGVVTDVDAALKVRMGRQVILDRPKPPTVRALVDEAALDRPGGGREVMAAQLAHLLRLSERPNVSIRVVPKEEGLHAGLDGSFKIMTLGTGDVGFMEACEGGRLIVDAAEVRSLFSRYDQISDHALPSGASRALIRRIMEEMSS